MSTTTSKSEARVREHLEQVLERDAELLVLWRDRSSQPPAPDGIWRGIFVLPAERVASLRHWRDELEGLTEQGDHFVAMEASKIARLLLKGHAPTLRWLREIPAGECPDELKEILADKNRRFDRIDAWLTRTRRAHLANHGAGC